MEVASTSAGSTPTKPPQVKPKAVISSDFETFLKMLSTQLQNQDPLNPVDSADYAVQLATFSSVEQQVLTNNHLEELTASFQTSGMADLAGWVGMQAKSMSDASFSGAPVTLAPIVPTVADRAVLIGKDSNGQVVLREDIPLNAKTYEWDGKNGSGQTVPNGVYSFELESSANGEILTTETVASYNRVVEARRVGQEVQLVLAGGQVVNANEVYGLRAPDATAVN